MIDDVIQKRVLPILGDVIQNRVLRHTIAQSKIDLTISQTGNLIFTRIFMDTNLKSLPKSVVL